MEHPVPQNVTSFEFHLVGDMTLKQFGYLAGGFAIAYVSFTVLLPINALLAIPLLVFSGLLGAAFAFVPILDRPLDHWVLAFFRAVYSPTQGFWKVPGSKGKTDGTDPIFKDRLQRYLLNTGAITPTVEASPALPQPKLSRLIPPPVSPTPTPPLPPKPEEKKIPSSENLSGLVKIAEEAHLLRTKLAQTEQEINTLQGTAHTGAPSPEYQKKFQEVSSNLQNLVEQTESLYHKTVVGSKETITLKPQVAIIEPLKQPQTQIALTSLPNVINGIISDHQGNYLEGIIVIIHNVDGLPVRALKTNKLGQFSGATPLPSGTYTITLEKEGLIFNTLQITLNGEIIQPINISPKGGEKNVVGYSG